MSRRCFFQITRDMLTLESGTKTDYMYAGKINARQLARYLDFLLTHGYVERANSEGNRTYRISVRGRELLAMVEEILNLLEPAGIASRR